MQTAEDHREMLIDQASLFSDVLTEAILEEQELTAEMISAAIRQGVVERRLTPVFIGSAYKNKGIQPPVQTPLFPVPRPILCDLPVLQTMGYLDWLHYPGAP